MINLWSKLAQYATGVAVLLIAIVVIGVPLDLKAQWMMAIGTIIGMMVLARGKSRQAELAIGMMAVIASTRYIFWRTTETLSFGTFPEFLLGTGLYLAELYAWAILLLGFLQTSWPLDRPVVEPLGAPENWPTVDIYIPTYNESLDIVRNTVFAAMDQDYPVERFNVYILDDGRRAEFRAFARSAGCGYITRDNNLHAKAGNLNAAMHKTDGELIVIFDCDHVPTRAFLQLTVGWFQREQNLALLQTPHYFYSPDPVQRNLAPARDRPGEGDLFYNPVQGGNDLWNATFFCGSCAVIRRTALMMTNGFAGETVTEDAHTALKLQRMGWASGYLDARLSAGLATERLVLHVGQRIRWARGMTQILRIDNPLMGKGLTWQQRLCYLNAMMHFQFPLPRIVFLTSPLAYLIFGQNIIQASASLIFAYAMPHLYCSQVTSQRAHGGWRAPFWGEIYETILAFHLAKPTIVTWFQPRKGKFNVTDKGDLLDRTFFDWEIVKPHLLTIGVLAFGIALGIGKRVFYPHLFNVQVDTLSLNIAWALFSLAILLAAVSVARETRQARKDIRVPAKLPVVVHYESGHVVYGQTIDISMGGAAIQLPDGLVSGSAPATDVILSMGDENLAIPVSVVRTSPGKVFVRFLQLDDLAARHLVRAVMGRADAWQLAAPPPAIGTLRSLRDILMVDFVTLKRVLRLNFAEQKMLAAEAVQAAAAVAAREAETAEAAKPAIEIAKSGPGKAAAALAKAAAFVLAVTPLALATLPQAVRAQPLTSGTTSSAGGVHLERMTFKDLRIRDAIRLQGTRGEISIPFGVRKDQVVTGANLRLQLAWSPALLADISQLVVLVNGEVVQTYALRPADAAGQVLQIPVNPALFLPGDNQLNLRLIGHYTRDCEDPFHSVLWANVSNTRSWLDLQLQTLPQTPDLSHLPSPFFDKGINTTLKMPFVFAGQPHPADLQAAASMASWLGSMASYRGFAFKPSYGVLPTGNAIAFMKRQGEIPGLDIPVTGPSAALVRNPRDPYGMVLVVMGRDAAELRTAAAAIATGRGVFGGSRMSFDGVRIPAYPRYSAPRWVSTAKPVKLGDIMEPYALQGLGLPPGPLSARFRVAPDLFFWPRQGGQLNLGYRYPVAKWLDRRASRLDISVNGQYLKTFPLAGGWWEDIFGLAGANSHDANAKLLLPRYDMFGQNELTFDYNLIMADKKRCTGTLPDNVRVAVDPNSTIDLTDAYHAIELPDLATFAGSGYPFTIRPDLGETTVLMVSNPTPASTEAFLNLMGRFGDSTGAAATGVTVTDRVEAERLQGQDILIIGGSNIAGASNLFSTAPVRYDGKVLQVNQTSPLQYITSLFGKHAGEGAQNVEGVVHPASGFSGIISFRSPYSTEHTVVAVMADDTATLPALVDGLADTKINAQVQGDLAVATGDGMSSFAVGPTYWVGSLPIWMRIAYWFSQRPLLMALGTVILALALARPIYFLFRRQAAKRLAAMQDH
ncbi:UDP-forming cellulose synthase catalytic subunit [Novosphingobium sp. FKTRR1]|uniref:UDP-forming cellulose synthase catalytic subunit n=1 Tax=Novosphingobium sp. FKTRR1 TaxID=2879118 RepID=UPI001CF0A2AF|nr:UDP-forming cellulose synthase catalytic subunit [Novosphingobium sp. FKTRR1]